MAATVAIAPDVKGPVKKVTTTIKLGDGKLDILYGMSKQPFPEVKYVFWYDSIGRLTEETTYPGGSHINGHVYQYHNNEMGVSYHYNEDGFIKGSFKQLFYDSLGNQISSRTYKDGKFFCADSTIYNTQGLKIEHYDTAFKSDSMVLTYSYEYDSIGRLITVNRKNEHIFTIEYHPNGNYTEHHSEKIKNTIKAWEQKYVLDNKGQIIKIQAKDSWSKFTKYDHHGNWLKSEYSYNTNSPLGWITSVQERIIEYYE
jgi:YD repeat-containing protein